MKKVLTIAFVSLLAVACNNSTVNTEEQEKRQRDSIDAAKHIADSLMVAQAEMNDTMSATVDSSNTKNEEHGHEGHNHEGHSH